MIVVELLLNLIGGFLLGCYLSLILCPAILGVGVFLGRVRLLRFAQFAGILLGITFGLAGLYWLLSLLSEPPVPSQSHPLPARPQRDWTAATAPAGFLIAIGMFKPLLARLCREALPQISEFDKKP